MTKEEFMFKNDDIPNNFNGKIFLGNGQYFFDVSGDVLRVFFVASDVTSSDEFREHYSSETDDGVMYGMCPDKNRVAFIVGSEIPSSYPDSYSEFRLLACIKEKFYWLGTDNTVKENEPRAKQRKLQRFGTFDSIRISGELIDAICSPVRNPGQKPSLSSENGDFKVRTVIVPPVRIKLGVRDECSFTATVKSGSDFTFCRGNRAKIEFSFAGERDFYDFYGLFLRIKRFVDFMAKARNTAFNVTLAQQRGDQAAEFADVKIFYDYDGQINAKATNVLRLDAVKNNLPVIFDNLCDEKYSLIFLPCDDKRRDEVSYADVRNLATAVELACELDKKYVKVYPRPTKEKIAKARARIVFDWCKKYAPLIERAQPQPPEGADRARYRLSADRIENFRRVRNDIAHRATGLIDAEIVSCYYALKSVLYYYVLGWDENSDVAMRI